MSTTKKILEEYSVRRENIIHVNQDVIAKRHKNGQLTARERINYLFDPDTFKEIGLFVKHRTTHFDMDKKIIPSEGVVTGFGKVNGRTAVAIAEDYNAMAGTFGEYHGKKFVRAIELARDNGWPVIGLNDSGGARLQEGFDTLDAYGCLFRSQILASGIVPQIALIMGPCLGGQAYHPIMQDFLIQCKYTGFFGIAGPAFVKTQIGEEITLEQLCGWKAHAIKSGQAHIIAEDDKNAIDKCKELLAFLPSNNKEKPPRIKTQDDPNRVIPELNTIIPDDSLQAYDVTKIITSVVDNGYFLELLKDYARNCIIGFARFDGRTTGIVANRPEWASGTIDVNASDKMSRFIRFCDLFNIPLVSFCDCPGYLIGSDQEWKGILRHGAKLLYAWVEATVPLISVKTRKSYAGAHFGMLDKALGADIEFAWPTAQISIVGAETAASVIFSREIHDADNPEEVAKKRIEEYQGLFENPYQAAERMSVDDIIMPSDTRRMINGALDILENKTIVRPYKKYSNINL